MKDLHGVRVEKIMYSGFRKSDASDVAEVLDKARLSGLSLPIFKSDYRLRVTKVNTEWAVDLSTGNIIYQVMMEGDII